MLFCRVEEIEAGGGCGCDSSEFLLAWWFPKLLEVTSILPCRSIPSACLFLPVRNLACFCRLLSDLPCLYCSPPCFYHNQPRYISPSTKSHPTPIQLPHNLGASSSQASPPCLLTMPIVFPGLVPGPFLVLDGIARSPVRSKPSQAKSKPQTSKQPSYSCTSRTSFGVADLPQVTDYLLKRGFTKTEHVFRQESSHLGPDGRPIHTRVEDKGPAKYRLSINNLKEWVEGSLDVYKVRGLPHLTVHPTDILSVRA